MADKNLPLIKTVYTKEQLGRIFDPEFTEFLTDPGLDQNALDEFFRLYNELFFDIPLNGATNSHEFLLRRSSEVTRLDEAPLDIQPLLDEIASLRRQLLDANRRILELEIQGIAQGQEISLEEFLALQNQIASLQLQLAESNATVADLQRQLAEGTAATVSDLLAGGLNIGGDTGLAAAEQQDIENRRIQEVVNFVNVANFNLANDIVKDTKKRDKREERLDFLRVRDLIDKAKKYNFKEFSPDLRNQYIVKGFNESMIKSRALFRFNAGRVEYEIIG